MLKVVVEALLIVRQDRQQYCAAIKTVVSVLPTTLTVPAVLCVITDQEQVPAVQNPLVVILTSAADLVVLHSGPAIVTVHVLLRHMWLFLRGYSPAMVLLLHTALKTTRTFRSGTVQAIISLSSC